MYVTFMTTDSSHNVPPPDTGIAIRSQHKDNSLKAGRESGNRHSYLNKTEYQNY